MTAGPVLVAPSHASSLLSSSMVSDSHTSSSPVIPQHLRPQSLVAKSEGESVSKRVEVLTVSAPIVERDDQLDFLPSRFANDMTKEYIAKLKTDYAFISDQLRSYPENGAFRIQVAQKALLLSEMYAYYVAEVQAAEELDEESETLCLTK